MKLRQKPKFLCFMEVLRFTSKAVLCLFLFGLASAIPQKASRVISQAGGGGILAQSFLREPFDQIAAVGEHVTLPCRVINKRGVLQWTRDDFGLGSERQLIGFDRYQMTGSDEEGDWTLDINPVTLEDDARFQCQIGAAEAGIAPIRSRYATLSVLVPPNPPKMLGGSGQMANGQTIHKTVEGRQVELRCESRGGKPAAEITWFTDDNLVIDEGVRTRTEVMKDGKRHVTISTLKFVAMTEHHNKNFTCQAQNSAIRQPQSVSTRLHVHYPPHVELIADHGVDGYVEEGSRVRFRCKAHANPPQMSYTWYVGGRRVADAPEASTELVLDHVDRRLHNHVVRCEVTNPIGKTDESALLNVAYPPMFIKRPEDIAGDAKERITLTCLVDANPKPTYAWYKLPSPLENEGKRRLVGNAANLSLMVSRDTIGEYVCKATTVLPMTTIDNNLETNTETKDTISNNYVVHANAKVYMRSKPTIYAKRENLATVGEIGRVVCEAISVPPVKPKGVEWFHSGGLPVIISDPQNRKQGGGKSKFSVSEQRTKEGVTSTLIIAGVSDEDFGEYTCRVTNNLGTHSKVLLLKRFPTVSLVVVLSGALGGTILTIAVIITLITCRRSRNSSNGVDHGFCFGSPGSKGGDSSDIVTVINRKSKNSSSSGKMTANGHPHHHHRTGAGSSSTTSTNDSGGEADGSQASNDSSSAELNKVEVRTSSSLSQNDAMVDDDDMDDVDGLHHHTHPANVAWGSGVKGLHVTSATGTASRRGNGMVVAAPVPVHSTTSNLHSVGTTGNNYVHVHPHQQHQHNNNNTTNTKLSALTANYSTSATNNYGDSNYYSSNLLHGSTASNNGYGGNYGSYNPGFNSSPSSSAGIGNASSSTNGTGASINLNSSPRYNPTVVKSADNLYSTGGAPHQTATSADINAKYSVHVRASPISPTYSQFSNGVSVKNCYPTYHPGGGMGYGGGIAAGKNTSFDYVSARSDAGSSQRGVLQQRFNSQQHHQNMVDNYSVYVNSAGVASSSSTSGLTPQPPPSSSSTIALHSDSSAAKIGSLATHV